MKKKGTVYAVIIAVWLCCTGLLVWSLYNIAVSTEGYPTGRRVFIIIMLSVNTVVLALLWLGSLKDFIFSATYAVMHKKFDRIYAGIGRYDPALHGAPRFLLLYCTCNDFNAEALSACMKQKYKNFRTLILDDSSDEEYRGRIDRFAAERGIEVIRRADKKGFKAGNLNNCLSGRTDYDYFVVLDSDEIIPPDFIEGVLKYFAYNKKCGAVQARHTASGGNNVFQKLMGLSVGSNGETVQVVKNFYGANALIGHGMAISRECYEKTGGFPLVVAEDISFAVKIKDAGFDVIYAPDILCREEFPVDYVSLKKRQCKWTQGNLEYMKKFDKEINRSSMRWFEKLDLKLSHYSLPIVPVLSLVLTLCTLALGFAGYPVINYALGIYVIMIVFLCSPMIPDLFVYRKSRNALLLLPYFIVNIATYASLAPMMIRTVIAGMFGKKATFIVTPKRSEKFGVREILRNTRDSLVFALIIGALALLACASILPVIFVVAGCLLSPFIIALSNISVKKSEERGDYIPGGETVRELPLKSAPARHAKIAVRI